MTESTKDWQLEAAISITGDQALERTRCYLRDLLEDDIAKQALDVALQGAWLLGRTVALLETRPKPLDSKRMVFFYDDPLPTKIELEPFMVEEGSTLWLKDRDPATWTLAFVKADDQREGLAVVVVNHERRPKLGRRLLARLGRLLRRRKDGSA